MNIPNQIFVHMDRSKSLVDQNEAMMRMFFLLGICEIKT